MEMSSPSHLVYSKWAQMWWSWLSKPILDTCWSPGIRKNRLHFWNAWLRQLCLVWFAVFPLQPWTSELHERRNSVNFANLIEVPLVNNYSYCSRITTRITSRSFVPLKGIDSRNQLNLIKVNTSVGSRLISDYDRQLIPTLISTPVGSNHEHQNSVNFTNLIEVPLVNNYSYCSRITTRITSRSCLLYTSPSPRDA